ncbi:MAG: enoyl-CoA hydratase/isomerase family protein [Vicinamibacterales bacterium]
MSLVHIVSERGGHWQRLVMDAPRGNLLSRAMVQELAAAVETAAAQPRIKWLTIEGAGPDFSYGAKIQEHLPGPMREILPEAVQLTRQLLHVRVLTAALVHGRCLGGGFELALSCDDILAADDAVFGLPEIRLAALPPMGAALLPARVGASRAARAVVTGEPLTAAYWHDAGLVSVVAPQATMEEAAGDWFDRHLAPRSAAALTCAVEASRLALRASVLPVLDAAERLYLDALLTTHDATEGIQAWIEKRPPVWEDR